MTEAPRSLPKTPTGTEGLDEILRGGFPKGRPVLVCGGAGCGKTLLGLQFLVRGALEHGEPGAFIAFEEKAEDLEANVASLGFDLRELQDRKLLSVDHVHVDRHQIIEAGDYDLEGLFLRLGLAIDSVGAKRVVIDTLETLFGGLSNYGIIRSELKRLFDWLKSKGVTAIITAERGEGSLTRHGLEEYVSDCVIVLDHRVTSQVSTRRLRVVKYRGSSHGTNEYPFLIDHTGISVMPITSVGLDHTAPHERISTGIPKLDEMLGGQGYFRASTVLLSGTAGAGKSSVSAHFVDATCRKGERSLYLSFEESPSQIMRNMRSIGLELSGHVESGLLRFVAARPTAFGLETHLALIHKHIAEFRPAVLVIDPASNFLSVAAHQDAHAMLIRLVDFFKREGITALLTTLTTGGHALEHTEVAISSIVDTWLLLKTIELSGERNRGLYILKSRGMDHSNQIREFRITSKGVDLVEPYIGLEGVLTGSARVAQEARERESAEQRRAVLDNKKRELSQLELAHRGQLERMQSQFESQLADLQQAIRSLEAEASRSVSDREQMARVRRSTV